MSDLYLLASNKPFVLPQDIKDFQNNEIHDSYLRFSVFEPFEDWKEIVKPILSMPYLYEVRGVENYPFFMYLEKFMEIGDVLELYYIPNQNWYPKYIKNVLENPQPIKINIGSHTYQNRYGLFQLNAKNLVEELQQRTLVTEYGVTTIENY